MSKYYSRIVESFFELQLESSGAILVTGPKGCGKTTTSEKYSKSIIKMQDPDYRDGYIQTANIKPSLLLKGKKPLLIDEWQIVPSLWDAVRTSVDDIGLPGQYILTGSLVVDNKKIMHSGTGRIARIKMYPMSLFESMESNGKISLKKLFTEDIDIDGINSELSIEQLIFAACRGGWPSTLHISNDNAKLQVSKNYFNDICDIDISNIDGKKRDKTKTRSILHSYARNVSTLCPITTILNDVKNKVDISENTLHNYIKALNMLYVLDDIEAWSPNLRSKDSIRKRPKRGFIDPSIAVNALGASPETLEKDLNTFGFIFESLCIRDLKIYSQKLGGNISYYSDKTGLEADVVLHVDNGDYALIEIKLGSKEIDLAAKNLLELNALIKEKKLLLPKLLIVLTGGNIAYKRPDGILVIPIGCLRD